MASPVDRAISAALSGARVLCGETVMLLRGDASVEVLGAIRGATNWGTDAPTPNSRIGERSTDWLIVAERYTVDGEQVEPARGDVILAEDAAGNETAFRVMPFGPSDQCWRWVDRGGRSLLRVHCKERLT